LASSRTDDVGSIGAPGIADKHGGGDGVIVAGEVDALAGSRCNLWKQFHADTIPAEMATF